MPSRKKAASAWSFDLTQPSVLARDKAFRANKRGLTTSQTATAVVAERTAKTGRNPGTIEGITRTARLADMGTRRSYLFKSGVK